MAETEVESILREIREQVLAQQRAAPANATAAIAVGGNGDGETDAPQLSQAESEFETNLALINSYLTTTARTWDRLPPLVSNRSGSSARLELWLKRQLKRATRWFTWEQVNFNASVHHALRDLLPILSAHEEQLANLREQIKRAAETQHVANEQLRVANEQLQVANEQFQTDLSAQRVALEVQKQAQEHALEEQRIQVAAQLADVVSEFRDRVMHVQEEQRVSFKQLALENSEAATREDRVRRQTEALLDELQRRLDQLTSS
ncbi:MAG TPA: hypothetical protein VGN90_18235 [Pyrinomonadaceae bacterium]|jgi:ribosome-binding protein aMBF1 (putative translation factor)|nr:hypothetical protein [Pyrinomonadaceae bacterium]